MKHTIQTIQAAQITQREITLDVGGKIGDTNYKEETVTGKIAVIERRPIFSNRMVKGDFKVLGHFWLIQFHVKVTADTSIVKGVAYLEPKQERQPKREEFYSGNELTAVAVKSKEGFNLSDINRLVAEKGQIGDNPFITLCIEGVETHTSRITSVVLDINDKQDGPGGVLWLHLDKKLENIINEAVVDKKL